MNKKKRVRPHRSQISKRILMQYILTVLGVIVALLACYFVLWFVCKRMIVWQEDDPVYYFLKAVEWQAPLFGAIAIVIGLVIVTCFYFSKPLRCLNEVVHAAERLSQPGEEPIVLSNGMQDIQNELNLAREQALRSAMQAKEAEQRKNDLIVYLAHDLKTPLTSVIGYLTLLEDEPQISPELRERYTGIARNKAERLEDLINEFFDITRFSLTHLTLERKTVNLSRMLEQLTNEFNPILAEKELSWEMYLTPDVHLICDPDKLERVFDNLFRNAVNYSYRGKTIAVSLKQDDRNTMLQIKNHGKTIAPEKLSRIFEQFFRLDSSRASATGGAGLGLAIAKEIVELHGGKISAESVDESILFTVSLPLFVRKS